MTIRNYFELWELTNDPINAKNPMWAKSNNKSFYDLLINWINIGNTNPTADELKFFQDYLYPLYWGNIISYIDKEYWSIITSPDITSDEVREMMTRLCGKLYVWYISSKEYYLPIINMYNNQINNLLGGIKTTSINRFNDTPQNQIISGETFEDLEHLTNVSRLESETDGETLINRLNDIRVKLLNLYNEWAKSFNKNIVGA